jgi:hypothetical protein
MGPAKMRLFPGWANARNDVAAYQRLAKTLGPRLLPVRPAGRKPLHVPGQISLWAGGPPVREDRAEGHH